MRASQNIQSVLIAAQDLRLARLIQDYLVKTGYRVECYGNLGTTLERLLETHVDLLIVDGEMPEKVLNDFVVTVAGLKPDLQMMAVGISEREEQGRTLSAFVGAFVEKPFSIYDISDTIQELPEKGPFDQTKMRAKWH